MRFQKSVAIFFLCLLSVTLGLRPVLGVEETSGSSFLEEDDLALALAELEKDEAEVSEKPLKPALIPPPKTAVSSVKKAPLSTALKTLPQKEIQKKAIPQADEFGIDQKKAAKKRKSGSHELEYSFLEHLEEAEVQILNLEREIVAGGQWRGDRFEFSGLKGTEIRTLKANLGGEVRQAVSVKLLPKHIYQIRYNEVPPFSKLTVQYLLKEVNISRAPSYMNLRVIAGKYELKRIQVSTKDPWRKQIFDLGVLSFLNRNIPISFEFVTGDTPGLTFLYTSDSE